MTWKEALTDMAKRELMIVPWENAEAVNMAGIKAKFPEAGDIGILIGPEGGMSENEVRALEEIGARQVTLGPRILRTETAAIAACTMAMLLWGDIG
jgi:16S rRNA (uracil1498-N3)-methyltransferase